VPSGERKRIRDHDHDVVTEPRIRSANLRVVLLDQEPMIDSPLALVEFESNDYAVVGQQVMTQVVPAPRPQDIVGFGMLAGELRPLLGPTSKRVQDGG
jgi:hypothetical protein